MELIDIVMNLKPNESVSISKLQKDYSIGFNKAKELFDALMDQEFIIKDSNKDRYIYNPNKYRQLIEEKYGNLSSLIDSYNGKKHLDLPKGMSKDEFIKLIQDNDKGMNLIFLDIDGVLNCRSTEDKCGPYRGIEDDKLLLIKKLVDKYNAKIVLISSWKEKWYKEEYLKDKQDDLANYLDEKLKKTKLEICDKTEVYHSRTGEVRCYLDELRMRNIVVNNYVIFDDDAGEYKYSSHLKGHLLLTSFEKGGLTKKHIENAAKILERALDARRSHW